MTSLFILVGADPRASPSGDSGGDTTGAQGPPSPASLRPPSPSSGVRRRPAMARKRARPQHPTLPLTPSPPLLQLRPPGSSPARERGLLGGSSPPEARSSACTSQRPFFIPLGVAAASPWPLAAANQIRTGASGLRPSGGVAMARVSVAATSGLPGRASLRSRGGLGGVAWRWSVAGAMAGPLASGACDWLRASQRWSDAAAVDAEPCGARASSLPRVPSSLQAWLQPPPGRP